jgi:lipoprotein-anchoring transpeptidase ErfK/SrfK
MENEGRDFFAFDESSRDGITVAVIRTMRGPQIVVGMESWQSPLVRRFLLTDRAYLLKEFYAFDPDSKSGVSVFSFDADEDGIDEIVAAQNGGTTPEVRIYDMFGTLSGKFLLHDPTYRGALSAAQVHADDDGSMKLATVANAPLVVSTGDEEKRIVVNLTQQRLYAYERGRIARTFLISSGTYRHPTPELDTEVLEKVPVKRYRWNYGPNNPDNYDLPNVKDNLRIYGPIYIHGAYWHNNFGYRMSHGCINLDEPDAAWIYNWAEVGTPVKTEY